MEKDQSEKARNELNGTDRSRNIDTFARLVMLVLRLTVVGVPHPFGQVRNGQRHKMEDNQHAHHDGNRDYPEHTEVADRQTAEDGSAQEGYAVGSADESVGLISLVFMDQDRHQR